MAFGALWTGKSIAEQKSADPLVAILLNQRAVNQSISTSILYGARATKTKHYSPRFTVIDISLLESEEQWVSFMQSLQEKNYAGFIGPLVKANVARLQRAVASTTLRGVYMNVVAQPSFPTDFAEQRAGGSYPQPNR